MSLARVLIYVVDTYCMVSISIFADLSGPSGCRQRRNLARGLNFGGSGGRYGDIIFFAAGIGLKLARGVWEVCILHMRARIGGSGTK
jgi:hypothetical protein